MLFLGRCPFLSKKRTEYRTETLDTRQQHVGDGKTYCIRPKGGNPGVIFIMHYNSFYPKLIDNPNNFSNYIC